MIPIHKKGPTDKCDNFRPVALIPLIAKVIEKIVHTRLMEYLEENGILTPDQFGFQRGKSTAMAATALTRRCLKGLDEAQKVGAWLLDLSKAFDCLDPSLLLTKLQHYKFDPLAVRFFRSYLHGWQQCVSLEGKLSDLHPLEYGVRQGSILGPTLFLIYINDLSFVLRELGISAFFYADDSAFVMSAEKPELLKSRAEAVMGVVEDWCVANRLTLNRAKTQEILFDLSCRSAYSVNYLGFLVDESFSWTPHCEALHLRISSVLCMLRRASACVSKGVMRTLYFGCFQSRIRYGIVLWGNSSAAARIFLDQKKAIRILAGVDAFAPCRPLFKELRVLTLYGLYILDLLTFTYENLEEFSSGLLKHHHATRGREEIQPERCRLVASQRGNLTHMGSKLFNHLPASTRALTRTAFRSTVKRHLLDNPCYTVEDFFALPLC